MFYAKKYGNEISRLDGTFQNIVTGLGAEESLQ
jgi:hypothetical protein